MANKITPSFAVTSLAVMVGITVNPLMSNIAIAAEGASAIDEIVVTARKRSENIQDVPISITAMSNDDLQLNGVSDLSDIQAYVPGLTIYAARGTSSTATAYIRGIGQSDPLWGVEPGIGIYVDDVYLTRPQGALLNMLDVERVEVLRGPQGTLYGRNTIGGAIKYITKAPTEIFATNVTATAGSYGRTDLNAYVSGSLSESLAASVAVGKFKRDGYGHNDYLNKDVGDNDVLTARAQLKWFISDTVNAQFSVDTTDDKSALPGAERLLANPYLTIAYGLDGSTTDDFYDANYGVGASANRDENSGGSITINWLPEGNYAFKSVTAYREGGTTGAVDFDLSPAPMADSLGDYFNDQLSQEFQLNFDNSDNWKYVVGVYWLEATAGGDVTNTIFGDTSNFPLNPAIPELGDNTAYTGSQGEVKTDSVAAYGDATWALSDKTSVSFGGRYTREKKSATVLNQLFFDPNFTVPVGALADFEDSKTWTNFSPRLSVDYQLTNSIMTYASISQGYKSGGYNIRANTFFVPESANAYDPEEVTSTEIGFKSSWADRVQFNMAIFNSDYKDVQVSVFTGYDSDSDGNNDSFFGDFLNAAEATIRGVELDYIIAFADSFRIKGNAAYLDAEYDSYISGGLDVADDNSFTNTPKYTYGVNAIWDIALGGAGSLTTNLGYSYRDDVQPDTTQSPLLKQEGYGLWNLVVAYRSADEHWEIAVEGSNLSDERYLTSGYDLQASGFPIVDGYYGAPRTAAARLTYRY